MYARFWYVAVLGCLSMAALTFRVSIVSGAGVKKTPSTSADGELTGKWTSVEHYYNGKPSTSTSEGMLWCFQGEKAYELHTSPSRKPSDADMTVYDRYRVDASKKPKQIDLVRLEETVAGPGVKPSEGRIWKDVYEIRDGKLVVCCYDSAGLYRRNQSDGKFYFESKRPAAIRSANGVHMWVFKRVEPGSAEDIWSPPDSNATARGAESKKSSSPGGEAAKDVLSGKWTAIEHDYDGKPWPGRSRMLWIFQDGKAYEVALAGAFPRVVRIYDRYQIDSSKDPKQLDLVSLNTIPQRPGVKPLAGNVWKEVFEIRDGKLVMCYYDVAATYTRNKSDGKFYNESQRPTEISSANKVHMWTFKRVEPGSADDVWSLSDIGKTPFPTGPGGGGGFFVPGQK